MAGSRRAKNPGDIVEAATRLLAADGIDALTIRRVASALECSPRTIYLYFHDKDELLSAIVESYFRDAAVAGSNAPPASTPRERLTERVRHDVGVAFSQPHLYRSIVTILNSPSHEMGEAQSRALAGVRDEIAALAGVADHPIIEAEMYTAMFFSAVRGLGLWLLDSADTMGAQERDAAIQRYIDSFLAMVAGSR